MSLSLSFCEHSLRFIYTKRKRIFPLIFVAVQCEHKIGLSMNPFGSDVAFAFANEQQSYSKHIVAIAIDPCERTISAHATEGCVYTDSKQRQRRNIPLTLPKNQSEKYITFAFAFAVV